jgi:hypothetical protein
MLFIFPSQEIFLHLIPPEKIFLGLIIDDEGFFYPVDIDAIDNIFTVVSGESLGVVQAPFQVLLPFFQVHLVDFVDSK